MLTRFRVLDEKDLNKRFNKLNYKIKNKMTLTLPELLNFAYIPIFARGEHAKEVTEKLVNCFKEIQIQNLL